MPERTRTGARVVTAATEDPWSPEDIAMLSGILDRYAPDDLQYTFDGKVLTIHLTSLDFNAFKELVTSLIDPAQPVAAVPGTISPAAAATLRMLLDKISAIRSYGIKGGKRLYAGYAEERKVRNRKGKESHRAQYFYAQDSPYPQENVSLDPALMNKIICADSELALKQYPSNSIDLIFTSPPYNFGLEYADNHDADYWPAYFDKLFAIFDECIRVLKHGGRIAVNVQPLFSDYIPSHHIVSNFFMSRKLIWKGEILWEKNNYNCKYTAWGSWRSPSNPYLKYTWEFIEVFAKGTLKKAGNPANADISAEEFKRWVVGRWSIAPERNMQRFNHPAMFPEELVARVLKLFSYQGDVVLDPFNGVGTTTLVARKLGRRYIGIDISPEYCQTAERRISEILI